MTTSAIVIHPIDEATLQHVRTTGVDVAENPVEYLVAGGGEPLRCCLRDAQAGESLILFGYEPPLPSSPYLERGAVYAHAEPCGGPACTTDYPSQWRGRSQVVRAYDARGWIRDAVIHGGSDPERVIDALLADPAVERVHSRNVAHGCYMFEATRG